MKQTIKKVKGTSDLILEEINKWQFVEQKFKALFEYYNYQEIRTPILEYSEIFSRAAEHSEMVLKEFFQFLDKKKQKIALRPEGTAPVIRSYLENKLDKTLTVQKFYYYGPFFRYERPQKGRSRQFHQIGIEYIGIKNSILPYLEVFFLIQDFLNRFGLKQAKIKINTLGDNDTRNRFSIDFRNYIKDYKKDLCSFCCARINQNCLRILDCRNCSRYQFLQKAPLIKDYLTDKTQKEFKEIKSILKKERVPFEVDNRLVRGLDYYTNLVFEIITPLKEKKTNLILGGGGSYNELTQLFGGTKKNCFGFAIGMERLILALEENSFFNKNIFKKRIDVYILALENDEVILESFLLLKLLRQNQIKTEMNLESGNFEKKFKKALKNNPQYLIFIGKKEIAQKTLTVKNLDNYQTKEIPNKIEYIIDFLKKEYK